MKAIIKEMKYMQTCEQQYSSIFKKILFQTKCVDPNEEQKHLY